MISRHILCLSLVLMFASGSMAGAAERYGEQKVIYHIAFEGGEGSKAYLRALTNVQNHLDAVGKENLRVEVVMHGDGLDLLKEAKTQPKLQSSIKALKAQNVKFDVCNNTLVNRKINYETDLFDVAKADLVPSGVAELSRLQQKGFTYIRP